MRRTILRLLSSFRSSRAERELAREIRSHLQLLEYQYIARGVEWDLQRLCQHQQRLATRLCAPGLDEAHMAR
jgi:hypothetical protein